MAGYEEMLTFADKMVGSKKVKNVVTCFTSVFGSNFNASDVNSSHLKMFLELQTQRSLDPCFKLRKWFYFFVIFSPLLWHEIGNDIPRAKYENSSFSFTCQVL